MHREWLAGRQVDMKIVFYELIRMITGHERERCKDSDMYDLSRTVGKIEGYQEVTNQMQRILNQKFILDIEELKKKTLDTKVCELEKQLEVMKEQIKNLSNDCEALENSNNLLKKEIEKINRSLRENDEYDQKNTSAVSEVVEINAQEDSNIDKRMRNMESNDLYLQGSQRMMLERLELGEQYSEYLEEKVNLIKYQKNLEPFNKHDFVLKDESLDEKIKDLKTTVQDIKNNLEMHDQLFGIEDNLTVGEAVEMIQSDLEIQHENVDDVQMTARKETGQIIKISDGNENENSSFCNDLLNKFRIMFNRIENMENLLENQSRYFSEFSLKIPVEKQHIVQAKNITSNKIIPLEETLLGIEKRTEETDDKIINTQIAFIKEDILNIRKNLQLSCKKDSEICGRLANIENHLFKLFGENKNHFSIYELIDLVVEINNSLGNLSTEFTSLKSQLEMLKSKLEYVGHEGSKYKQILAEQSDKVKLAFECIESLRLKQVYYRTFLTF